MRPFRVAIVGGGITGLAAAHRLRELGAERGAPIVVSLIEAGDRVGGPVRTVSDGEHLLEEGPDALVAQKPAAVRLAARIGLGDEVVPVGGGRLSGTEVVHRGRLVRVPAGFLLMAPGRLGPIVRSPLFSLRGKLRMAWEPWVPPRPEGVDDESVASFVRRRFGAEALDRVAEPVVGGLYTANTEELSLRCTLPQFLDLERQGGSVARAIRRQKRPPGAPALLTLRRGLGTLVEAIAARLPDDVVRCGVPVEAIRFDRAAGAWKLDCASSGGATADAVILACPSFASARIVRPIDAELSASIGGLDYASCATVTLAYRRKALGAPLRSFGFFVPRVESMPILACSYTSEKFEGRGPSDRFVTRSFVGGSRQPELLELDDDRLVAAVHQTLARLLRIEGGPTLARVHRFPRSMPQYRVGQARWIEGVRARAETHPGLFLAGSAVGAKGLPDCVRSGEEAATAAAELAASIPERLRPAM